jgi:carboxyl-terminal processing protease
MPAAFLESASHLAPWLADAAAKGTVLLVVAWLVALAMNRSSAARRHLAWSATAFALLLLPLLSPLLPTIVLPAVVPSSLATPPQGPVATDAPKHAESLVVLMASRDQSPQRLPQSDAPPPHLAAAPIAMASPFAWRGWLVVAWGVGAALSLAWIALGFACLAGLRRRSETLDEPGITSMLNDLATELGIRRPIVLLGHPGNVMPMTWGLFRPVVLLPQQARLWSNERLRLVLLHELAHVRRLDWLTQLAAHLMRAVYWFHPLAWLCVSRQRAEQEFACDDLVLAEGECATDYAEHLLVVTTGLPLDTHAAPVALAMARASHLHRRIVALLDDDRDRRPPTRRARLGAFVGLFTLASLLSMLVFGSAGPSFAQDKDEPKKEQKKEEKAPAKDGDGLARFKEVAEALQKQYVTPLDAKAIEEAAIKGVIDSLKDPYVSFLPAEELMRFERELAGGFTGVGVQVRMIDNRLTVITPIEGSPAIKAGVRPGDVIVSIDGKSTQSITLEDAVKKIMGPKGSVVKMKVMRNEDGAVEELAITRGPIAVRSVLGFQRHADNSWNFLLDGDHKVGYVHITQFSKNTTKELGEALAGLKKDGVKGLILDLRDCPGGMLNEALDLCKLFLAKGKLLTIKAGNGEEKSWDADGPAPFADLPLAILVCETTASAAEIVAGSLGENKRAVILGSRTFGKGSVQAIVKLDDGSALKVTTAFHYLPSGRNIQKRAGEKSWGVDPTDGYYLPLSMEQREALRNSFMDRSKIGHKPNDDMAKPKRVTPKLLEDQFADPQLGAALKTMVARITGGEFVKMGFAAGLQQDQLSRLEELRSQREKTMQSLRQLDREIADLQQAATAKEKSPK